VSNELRQARQDLNALRERRQVDLPAERTEIKNEVAEIDRQLAVAQQKVERLRNRAKAFTGTRVANPPQQTGVPVGTSAAVIIALGCILGGVAGVLAAFFAEFVSAARQQRPS